MSGTLLNIAMHTASRSPMIELDATTIALGTGLANDFRGKPGKREVTVLSKERWAEACEALGAELPWTLRRANLLIEGIDFDNVLGKQLRIGEVLLKVNGECEPCRRMNEAHKGLKKALKPRLRAGLLCSVFVPGEVKKGDTVAVVPS